MHSISSRWRKPKARLNKRTKAILAARLESVGNNVNDGERANDITKVIVDNFKNNDENVVENNSSESSEVDLSASIDNSHGVTDNNAVNNCNTSLNISHNYIIMSSSCFKPLLQNLVCDECGKNSLNVKVCNTFGFSSKLELFCDKCFGSCFSSERESESKAFDVNMQMVRAFLSSGKGHAAMENFSMNLGVSSMDSKTFAKCFDKVSERNVTFKNNLLKLSCDMVRDAHVKADNTLTDKEIIDLTVSYDGSWHKRGHTSLYGIGCVIDSLTNLVVDYEVLSKYCPECVNAARDLGVNSFEFSIWNEGHSCQKNFAGSSGSMEVHAALKLWKRSVADNKLRYSTIVCDGDSKTFLKLNEEKVYAPEVSIIKEECINHVSKRLGTALRNKVKEWRIKKVTLGGRKKGRLTDATITKLQNYYRKAIKDNAPDLTKMKTSILATLYHLMSTDDKPQHSKCPKGISSWCFFQRALAANEKPNSHTLMKTQLSEDIVEKILPVYQRLASDELLRRCVSGKTQNANESLHSCIWSKCPKEIFVSKKRLEYAVALAVSEFNFGCSKTLELQQGILFPKLDDNSIKIAAAKDLRRTNQNKRKSSQSYKIHRRAKRPKGNSTKTDASYSAGAF